MIERPHILALVLKAVQAINEDRPSNEQLTLSEDTLLFGDGAELDSLSLVSVIVDIETAIADEFGQPISLTDDRAMNRTVSPFTHVAALVEYILELLSEQP